MLIIQEHNDPLGRLLRTFGSRLALTTAGDDDGGSQRTEIGGFHLRKRDVCGNADHDDGREGYFDGVYSLESAATKAGKAGVR